MVNKIFMRIKNLISAESYENKKAELYRIVIEIFIITIGILIAIYLNNWNNERNAKKQELDFLKDFRKSLVSDTLDFNSNINGCTWWVNEIYKIKKRIEEKSSRVSDLDFSASGFQYVYIIPSSQGLYEELKSKGLSNITDETLRKMIIKYFEEDMKATHFSESLSEKVRDDIRVYYTKHFDKWFTDNNSPLPLDSNFIMKDPVFKNLITQKAGHLFSLRALNTNLVKQANLIMERICLVYKICD